MTNPTTQALYWFATDWHNGPTSALYALLEKIQYHPSKEEFCCTTEDSRKIYDDLERMARRCYANAELEAERLMKEIEADG